MFGKPKEKGLVQRVNVAGRTFTFTSPLDATDKDKADALIKLLSMYGDRALEIRVSTLEVELGNANARIENLGQAVKLLRKRQED